MSDAHCGVKNAEKAQGEARCGEDGPGPGITTDAYQTELVPEDGVIFPATEVTAYEGESVFNVLHRAMKQAKIHMVFRNTPIDETAESAKVSLKLEAIVDAECASGGGKPQFHQGLVCRSCRKAGGA